MAARIPISTLQEVLTEAGLPLSGADAMKRAKPFAGQAIEDVVGQRFEPQFAQLDADRKRKIETLAKVDKELMQSLSDPSFSGYLENPNMREKALGNVQNIMAGDVGLTDIKSVALSGELEETIKQSEEMFANLYAQTKENERGSGTGEIDLDSVIDDVVGFSEELSNIDQAEIDAIIKDLGL